MIKITKTDDDKQRDGVWTEYYGVKLLIARFPSDEASKILNRIRKRRRNREIDVTSDEAQAAIRNMIAEKVLLGWDNFDHEYTVENARQLLKDDPDCLDFVSDFSRDIDNFLMEDEDTTVGES